MATLSFSSACPRCARSAPIVLRGLEGRCAACGAPRVPLTAPTVSLAGRPARIGGTAALYAGSSVLVVGLSLAVGMLLLLQSLWPATALGWAVAIPFAALSLFFGVLLVLGGRKLRRHGAARRRAVELEAARAAIAHRNGIITASEAAHALGVTEEQADALLTELSRDANLEVNIEFDDEGRVRYVFGRPSERFRVLDEQAATEGELDTSSSLGTVTRASRRES